MIPSKFGSDMVLSRISPPMLKERHTKSLFLETLTLYCKYKQHQDEEL